MRHWCIVLWGLILLLPLPAAAAWTVNPRLDLRFEYNDNLFLEADRSRGDQIRSVIPGVAIDYQKPWLTLGADYSLHFRDFSRYSERDETRLRDVQRANLLADLFPGRDFTLQVADTLSRVPLDERRALAEENDFLNRSSRNLLRVSPSYSFRKLRHFTATLGYQYERTDYEADEGDDAQRHGGSLDLSHDLSAGLALLAGGSGRFHRADRTEDYDRLDYYGGARWRVSPRVVLEGRVGQVRIEPDRRDDTDGLLLLVRADYTVSPQLVIGGQAAQDFADSATLGLLLDRTLTGNLGYRGKFTLDLAARAAVSEYEVSGREDRSTGLRLALGFPLGPRTTLGLGGDVTRHNFRPEDEVVYRYGANLSLSYIYRLLFLRGSYAHRVSDSTFAVNDYRNNIVGADIGLRF